MRFVWNLQDCLKLCRQKEVFGAFSITAFNFAQIIKHFSNMKKVLIFALLASLVYACSESGGDKAGSEPTASTPKVDGEKIYKTYCVTCHGLYGDMGASGAFNLQTSALPVEERINVIANGRNVMTPFKDLLSEEKIKAVAEYTMTLKK